MKIFNSDSVHAEASFYHADDIICRTKNKLKFIYKHLKHPSTKEPKQLTCTRGFWKSSIAAAKAGSTRWWYWFCNSGPKSVDNCPTALIAAHRTRGWGSWNEFKTMFTTCSKFLIITCNVEAIQTIASQFSLIFKMKNDKDSKTKDQKPFIISWQINKYIIWLAYYYKNTFKWSQKMNCQWNWNEFNHNSGSKKNYHLPWWSHEL